MTATEWPPMKPCPGVRPHVRCPECEAVRLYRVGRRPGLQPVAREPSSSDGLTVGEAAGIAGLAALFSLLAR